MSIKKTLKKQRGRDAIINAFLDVHMDVADLMIAWKKNRYKDQGLLKFTPQAICVLYQQ